MLGKLVGKRIEIGFQHACDAASARFESFLGLLLFPPLLRMTHALAGLLESQLPSEGLCGGLAPLEGGHEGLAVEREIRGHIL